MATGSTPSITLFRAIQNLEEQIHQIEGILPSPDSDNFVSQTAYLDGAPSEENPYPVPPVSPQYQKVESRLRGISTQWEATTTKLYQLTQRLQQLQRDVSARGTENASALSLKEKVTLAISSGTEGEIESVRVEVESLGKMQTLDAPTRRMVQEMLQQIGQAHASSSAPEEEKKEERPFRHPRLGQRLEEKLAVEKLIQERKALASASQPKEEKKDGDPSLQEPKELRRETGASQDRHTMELPRATAPQLSAPSIASRDRSGYDSPASFSSESDDECPSLSPPVRISFADFEQSRQREVNQLKEVIEKLVQLVAMLEKKNDEGFIEAVAFITESGLNQSTFNAFDKIAFSLYHMHRVESPSKLDGSLDYGTKAFQTEQASPEEKLRAAQRTLVMSVFAGLGMAIDGHDQVRTNEFLDILAKLNLDPKDLPKGKKNLTHYLYEKLYHIYKAEAESEPDVLIHPHDPVYKNEFGRHAFRDDVEQSAIISSEFKLRAIEEVAKELFLGVWQLPEKERA